MNDKCFYCGKLVFRYHSREHRADKDVLATKDHYIPRMIGGAGAAMGNIVTACKACNDAKGDAPAELFEYFILNYRPELTVRDRYISFRQFCFNMAWIGFRHVVNDCLEHRNREAAE